MKFILGNILNISYKLYISLKNNIILIIYNIRKNQNLKKKVLLLNGSKLNDSKLEF